MGVDTTLIESNARMLQQKLSGIDIAIDVLRESGLQYKARLADLQRQCPHPGTWTDTYRDGPDIKMREICNACGAEVR